MYRRQQRGNSGNDDDDGGDGGGGGGNGGNGDSHVPPWLVRAEVTIRRGNAVTSETVRVPPGTTTTTNASGIRMICRWNTSETSPATPAAPIPTPAPAAASSSPRVDGGDRGGAAAAAAGGFGFQRGNILFTSTPPERPSPAQPRPSVGSYTLPRSGSSGNDDSVSSTRARAAANISDSGYTSEQFSHPLSYSSLPSRRQSQQYNRRCKSTCSIVLQSIAPAGADKDPGSRIAASPATKSPKIASVDPWQQYRRPSHQLLFPPRHQFSTVPEVCEDCAEGGVASSAFTTHFCTRVAEKSANRTAAAAGVAAASTISKDVASQTTDVESVRSSSTVSKGGRVKRRPATGAGQSDVKKKEEIRSSPASAGTSGSVPPPPADPEKSDSSTREDSSKRKSRTVHIDVYCTGSDDDLGTDSTSDDERSTPMTVFENEDVRITHTQATNDLPRGFQDENAFLKRSAERRCASFRNAPMRMPSLASSKGYDSDEMLSSLYPSRFSSYSALRDLDSSVPWSAASSSTMMSCENDSATMTSSKDTFSDVESLINSRSGLTPCDSFEYANSTDRDRIRRLDLGAKDKSKNWRSPQIERRQLLRSKRMKEYMEKHELGWSDDSAEESDESGAVGWSFVSGGGADDGSRLAKRGGPRGGRAEESNVTDLDATDGNARGEGRPQAPGATRATAADHVPPYSGVLRDRIGPFGSKSPSPLPSTIPSRVTSPFTTPYGERTDHIVKASMFGAVISAFRKPGHHIGPAKNPSCACEHCRRFFEETRRRSSSLSELERHPGFKPQK